MRKPVGWMVTLALVLLAPLASAAPTVGQPAPALVLPDLAGQTFDLAAQRGHVVIVNFWATWCPPCREEMPALDAFYQRYREQGVLMVGVSVDKARARDDVKQMMARFHYAAGLVSDAKPNDFGNPRVLPVTYVVDSAGVVRAVLRPDVTPVTEQSLSDAVLPLLAK